MAAGAGRRIGNRPKSLLERDGEALLLRQIRLLTEVGASSIAVVLGHHAQALAPVLQAYRSAGTSGAGVLLSWVVNPAPDLGPGSSLRCGLRALPAVAPTYLVVLGDQPLLEPADIETLLAAWAARTDAIELVVPRHGDRFGHPIVFGQALRRAVLDSPGLRGIRQWRTEHPEQVQFVLVGHARCTTDVDTPEDIQALQRDFRVRLRWPAGSGLENRRPATT